jgi:hypothetical protein
MAKPWAEVKQSDAFKALSSNDQEAARNEYFQQVVAPQVPTADLADVRVQFDGDTAPTVSNWVRDKFSSATAPSVPEPVAPSAPTAVDGATVAPAQAEPAKAGLMDRIGSAMNSYRDNLIAAGNILTSPATVPAVPKTYPSAVDSLKDTGLDLWKSLVGVNESIVGLADVVTGNLAGKAMAAGGYDPQGVRKRASSLQSPERQAADAEVQKATGFIGKLQALKDNPISAVGTIAESSLMSVSGAMAVREYAVRALAAAGIEAGTAAATTFLTSSSMASKLLAVSAGAEGLMTTGSVQEQGRQAGRDWSDTVLPALAAGGTTALISYGTSKIPGFKDAEVGVATAGLTEARKIGLLQEGKNLAKTMFKEGVLEELPQSMQEQVWTNIALGRPWDEGVPEAGAQGMVAGVGQGGGMHLYSAGRRKIAEVAQGIDANKTLDTGMEYDQSAINQQVVESMRPSNGPQTISPAETVTTRERVQAQVAAMAGLTPPPAPPPPSPPAAPGAPLDAASTGFLPPVEIDQTGAAVAPVPPVAPPPTTVERIQTDISTMVSQGLRPGIDTLTPSELPPAAGLTPMGLTPMPVSDAQPTTGQMPAVAPATNVPPTLGQMPGIEGAAPYPLTYGGAAFVPPVAPVAPAAEAAPAPAPQTMAATPNGFYGGAVINMLVDAGIGGATNDWGSPEALAVLKTTGHIDAAGKITPKGAAFLTSINGYDTRSLSNEEIAAKIDAVMGKPKMAPTTGIPQGGKPTGGAAPIPPGTTAGPSTPPTIGVPNGNQEKGQETTEEVLTPPSGAPAETPAAGEPPVVGVPAHPTPTTGETTSEPQTPQTQQDEPQTPPATTPAVTGGHWLDSLTTTPREAVLGVMRDLRAKSDAAATEAKNLSPTNGSIPVGSAHIEPTARNQAYSTLLDRLAKGDSVPDAATAAKQVATTVFENWNKTREYQVQHSVNLLDPAIDTAAQRLVQAGATAETVTAPGTTAGPAVVGGPGAAPGPVNPPASGPAAPPKTPATPAAEVTAETPVTERQAKNRWTADKPTLAEADKPAFAANDETHQTLDNVPHVVSADNAAVYHYTRDKTEPKKLVLTKGYSSDAAKAAHESAQAEAAAAEQKKIRDAEEKANPMGVAIAEEDLKTIATLLYGKTEVTDEMIPILFPEEGLIRMSVDPAHLADVEAALVKHKFRITDRSVPVATDDPSVTGPARVSVSALYRPGKTDIQDGGAVFVGNRKGTTEAPKVPKDATDGQVDKLLKALAPDVLFNINSNPIHTFGSMMFKEAMVNNFKLAPDYLKSKLNGIIWISSQTGTRQAIKQAIAEGHQDKLTILINDYVIAANKLQSILHDASNADDLVMALRSEYVKDATARVNSERYTSTGLDMVAVSNDSNLARFIDRQWEIFSRDENSTDQTQRAIKKDPDQPPPLGNIIRRGMKDHRSGRDVDTADFIKTFGFFPEGISFGNWVNQAERAAHLNAVYDALYDMADLSGISPIMLGLGQKLKLAIGAQGKGGKTAAWYIPSANEINLTKTKGSGTFAHEWHHGVDHNLRLTSNGARLMEETVSVLMNTREADHLEQTLRSILKDTAASKESRNVPPKEAFFAQLQGGHGSMPPAYYTVARTTAFYTAARKMDEGGEAYWRKPTELLSRSFESMLYDASKGGTPYLVGPSRADGYISPKNGFDGTPYPTGKERKLLAAAHRLAMEQIDPDTLEVKTYKVEAKIVHIEGLGYAVVDQFNLAVGAGSGNYAPRWHKDQRTADRVLKDYGDSTGILTPLAAQMQKLNERAIDMAQRIDAIMEELGLFKWPEVKNGTMAESMFYHMRQGWWPKNNNELAAYALKAYIQQPKLLGLDPTTNRGRNEIDAFKASDLDRVKLKQAQEDFEAAAARYVGQIITDMRAKGSDDLALYNHLVGLYQSQPTLDMQDSTSQQNQAYSTPIPISFISGLLNRMTSTTTMLEPTAGNGSLAITANPKNVIAIELEDRRVNNLKLMEFGKVIQGDALVELDKLRDQEVDTVDVNPPFGMLESPVPVPSWDGQSYRIAKLDHLIAAKSLRMMANNGRATLILGANQKTGAITSNDRIFLNWLYANYNVADHFEISGPMYRKQGASWPLRVLVIAGRNQTNSAMPVNPVIDRVENFDQLWSRYVQARDRSEQVVVGAGKPRTDVGGKTQQPGSVPAGSPLENGNTGGSVGAGGSSKAGGTDTAAGGSGVTGSDTQRGASGNTGSGKQSADQSGDQGGRPGVGAASGATGSAGSGGSTGRGNELGNLSDLDIDDLIDGLDEAPKTKRATGTKPGTTTGTTTGITPKTTSGPASPRQRQGSGPIVIPPHLAGIPGLSDLLGKLGEALGQGKTTTVAPKAKLEKKPYFSEFLKLKGLTAVDAIGDDKRLPLKAEYDAWDGKSAVAQPVAQPTAQVAQVAQPTAQVAQVAQPTAQVAQVAQPLQLGYTPTLQLGYTPTLSTILNTQQRQVDEALARLARQTATEQKGGNEDPASGLYSRKGEASYAEVKPILQQVWDAIGAQYADFKQRVQETYNLLKNAFAGIKEHLRTFLADMRDAQNVERPANQTPVQAEAVDTENQVVYFGKSRYNSEGIYLPRSQAAATYAALENVEAREGNIDDFVATELGYSSTDEMAKGLAGYQIDALALAISANQQGKGFVIGDDTGVGKGRTAAAMLVWAIKNGKVPIFLSLSETLYSDMYRDLKDIGHGHVRIGMTNASSKVVEDLGGGRSKTLFENTDGNKRGKTLVAHLTKTGTLPPGVDVVFTTYSQLNGTGQTRNAAIASLVRSGKAALVMDEAHNAAGSSSTNNYFMSLLTGDGLFGKDSSDMANPPPDDWAAPPTLYLSATFAKRPDNMPLYIHTNLQYAANTPADLKALFGKGAGVDVKQQIASEMLVESGSMIRRERSYDGVSMDFKVDEANAPRDSREVDNITTVLRTLVTADRALKDWTALPKTQAMLVAALAPPGSSFGKTGNSFNAVEGNPFTSVVHNYISQLLLATKIQTAIDQAVEKMNGGEKIVLALQNTMGALLDDYASTNGIKAGDDLPDLGWQTVLQRGVDSTRRVTLKSATGNKEDNIREVIPFALMPSYIRAGYDKVAKMIEQFKSDLPVSPIDAIRQGLEAKFVWTDASGKITVGDTYPEGSNARHLVVKEVSGRSTGVDYQHDVPKLYALEDPDRVAVISAFQNGDKSKATGPVDIIVLTAAGATGISLHASVTAFDQRKRHMIVLQPHADISIFKQLLGRIHRTGQVEWPSFTMLATGIPAERRVMAVIKKKMASLMSNTSAGSTNTSIEGVDFINQYGDVSTARYLMEHSDIREFMGYAAWADTDDAEGTDIALKASGRAGLLTVAEQQEYFDSIESDYNREIETRNATGTNALTRRVLPFEAKLMESTLLEEGLDSTNPFLRDAAMDRYEVNIVGDIPTQTKVEEAVAQALAGRKPSAVVDQIESDLKVIYDEAFNQLILKQQEITAASTKADATPKEREILATQQIAIDLRIKSFGARREQTLWALKNSYPIGSGFTNLTIHGVEASAVVISITVTKSQSKTGNPFAPSNFTIHLQRNIPAGRVPLSLATLEGQTIEKNGYTTDPDLADWFQLRDAVGGRKLQYIATGNVLRAQTILSGQSGTGGELANFTLAGKTTPALGLVMPAKFDPGPLGKQPYALRTPQSAANFALSAWSSVMTKYAEQSGMDEHANLIKAIDAANPYKGAAIDPDLVQQYREKILRGKGNAWILGIQHYSPQRGMTLTISGELKKLATNRELTNLLGGVFAKKRGDPFYLLDRSAPDLKDPAKIVAVIKVLSRFAPATVEPELATHAKLIVQDEFDTSEKKRGMRSLTGEVGQGQTADAVRAQISKIATAIPGITVEVVQSASDLPESAAPSDVAGVWYSGTTVYLVADNLDTAKRAQMTLAHEAIGHAALEAMLGPKLMAQLVRTVQNLEILGNRAIKSAAAEVDRTQPNLSKDRRAKEIVANMAETGQHNSILSRVVQAVRNWLRDRGFTLEFSEQDIRAMLRDAEKFVGRESTATAAANTATAAAAPAYSRRFDRAKADAEAAILAAKSSAIGQKASQIVTSAPVKATGRAINYGASKAALSAVYAAGKTANGVIHTVNNPVTRAALTFITPPARLAGKGIAMAAKGAAIPLSMTNRATDTVLKNATGLGFIAKHITGPTYDAVVRQITENDLGDSRLGRFAETMRSGLISQYGLTEADKQRHIDMTSAINKELRYAKGLVEQLHGITRDESRVIYLWLNTQPTGSSDASTDPEQVLFNSLPEESKVLLREIKQKLVDMGQEAVKLHLLDKQTWEKNKFAYLHRDYAKYEFAQTAQSQQRANTLSIMADSFKHRGMTGTIEDANVIAADFAAATAKDARLVRLDRMSKNGLKVRQRVWIPEVLDSQGAAIIPKEYKDWVQDAGGWDVRSADNGKVKVWRDFTPSERKILGELDEARYAVATTISQLAHDIEVAKYLRWVADEHSVPEDTVAPDMIVKAYDFQMLLGDVRRGSYVRVPDTVVSDTTRVKKYGALAGKIIPAPMWNEIRQVKNRSKPLGDTYDKFLRMWKMNKTVLSPVTHMNNTISNFIMGDLHDVQPIDVVHALELLHKKGKGDAASIKMIERFEDSGAMHGTFLNAEMRTDLIQPLLDKLRAEMTGQLGDLDSQITLNQIVSLINDKEWTKAVTALQYSQGADYAKKFLDAMSSSYQNEDGVFRLAKFMSDVSAGMTDREAGKNAREAFLDYDITAPWIQNMRATGFPFIAFAYRMIPKLMWIGAHRPWKLAKYSSLLYLAGLLGMAMGGIDKDEWERMRKLLPQTKTGLSPFFGDRIIPIGKDKHGRIVTIDVNRWLPSSDALEISGGDANVLPMWVPFNPGGPLTLAVELLANKSLFTGKPIWLASDTSPVDLDRYGMEAPAKASNYLWKALAPNMPGLPGTYTTDKMMNAWNANTDQFGREFTLPTAALSAVGIKVAPMGLDSMQRNEILKMERNVREIRAGITQKAKGASPVQQEGLNRALVTQTEKIQREAAITEKRINP